MSERGPDFDELVGPELEPGERERLLRVHRALLEAGPPPELSSRLGAPPVSKVVPLARRRRVGLLALAAALGVLAFAVGYLVAEGGGPSRDRVIAMTGSGGATGSLEIFAIDEAGNWPMRLHVNGLAPSASGRLFELWLTDEGKLEALCGSFRAEVDGTTSVPMNAPYRFSEFDGWVVVEKGSTTPVLTT